VYLVDDTPRTIIEAYGSPHVDYWKRAIRSGTDFMMSNGTLEVVDCWHFLASLPGLLVPGNIARNTMVVCLNDYRMDP
jgi:hypothetical protein